MSIGVSRQEYWSGLPCPSPGDLPTPGIEPGSTALQAESLLSEPPGKPLGAVSCHLRSGAIPLDREATWGWALTIRTSRPGGPSDNRGPGCSLITAAQRPPPRGRVRTGQQNPVKPHNVERSKDCFKATTFGGSLFTKLSVVVTP